MPEYFFHIHLEVFAHNGGRSSSADTPAQFWTDGDCALAPFLRSTTSKAKLGQPDPTNLVDSPSAAIGRASYCGSSPRSSCDQATNTDFPHSNSDDKRIDSITIEGTDMAEPRQLHQRHKSDEDLVTKGIGSAISGLQTKGRYIPLDQRTTESAWGIVHLYRDAEETHGLTDEALNTISRSKRHVNGKDGNFSDQDCTTLCILAVPSYLAPSDFLGFVGEETRDAVSHFRMIKTARANRYMVLMKFRNGKKAREWQKEWNGKVFNSMEVRSQGQPAVT